MCGCHLIVIGHQFPDFVSKSSAGILFFKATLNFNGNTALIRSFPHIKYPPKDTLFSTGSMHELGVKHVLLENLPVMMIFQVGKLHQDGGVPIKSIALNGRRVNDPRQNMPRKIMPFMLQMVKLTIAYGDYNILQI